MAYAIGIALAPAVSAFARWSGLDRDRAFYPTVLIVTASYYVLFAVLGGSMQAIGLESLALAACVVWIFRQRSSSEPGAIVTPA